MFFELTLRCRCSQWKNGQKRNDMTYKYSECSDVLVQVNKISDKLTVSWAVSIGFCCIVNLTCACCCQFVFCVLTCGYACLGDNCALNWDCGDNLWPGFGKVPTVVVCVKPCWPNGEAIWEWGEYGCCWLVPTRWACVVSCPL